jgi:hypothetical protein
MNKRTVTFALFLLVLVSGVVLLDLPSRNPPGEPQSTLTTGPMKPQAPSEATPLGEEVASERVALESATDSDADTTHTTQLQQVSDLDLPLLAAGSVVDLDGAPVAGARVWLSYRSSYSPDREGEQWSEVRSGDDGRFRCHGRTGRDSELRVHAAREGYFLPRALPCICGDEGLLIVLHQSGALAYKLIAPEGMQPQQWPSMVLWPEDADGERTPLMERPTPNDDETIWDSIPPGAYTLRFQHDSACRPFLDTPGIVIAAGQTTRDPRLLPLDLGQELGMIRITLLDVTGAPFEGNAWFEHQSEASSTRGTQRRLEDGSYIVPTVVSDSAELLIASEGCRSVRITALDRDHEIVMSDRFALTLRLTSLPPAPSNGSGIAVVLERLDDGTDGLRRGTAPEVEGNPCTRRNLRAYFHEEGTYTVIWRVERLSKHRAIVDEQYPAGEIRVDEFDHDRVIELTPPEELFPDQ